MLLLVLMSLVALCRPTHICVNTASMTSASISYSILNFIYVVLFFRELCQKTKWFFSNIVQNGWMPDLPEPETEPKSGVSLVSNSYSKFSNIVVYH